MVKILVDTGFWIALFEERDSHHGQAVDAFEYLKNDNIVMMIPFPTLYETLKTRFTRNKINLRAFDIILKRLFIQYVEDNKYKEEALELTLTQMKTYSMVDNVIRLMLADETLKVNYLLTFNRSDFDDICTKRNIHIFN
ncbi:hypothetical protein EZS27_002037 [termite gut metagenome]|uniref:PIN domain-containing protein n=1 Tax=termite gut metagenome TaxID=433724 RepID=A0A5J4SWV1_9ZZZZ